MTIQTAYTPLAYSGNGVTNAFPINWPYQFDTDIVVKSEVVATGVITTLVLGTDYLVSPIDNSPATTGTVTTTTAPPTGTEILITRSTPITQETAWLNNASNPAVAIENAVDKLTMIEQELTVNPFQLTGTTDEFLRGDNTLTNTLVGTDGTPTVPADAQSLLNLSDNGVAAMRVLSGATDVAAYRFGHGGSSNAWDMQWGYDPSTGKLGWYAYGGGVLGTFDASGNVVVSGTTTSTFLGHADASLIDSGLFAPARLASNSAAANLFLRGDQLWALPPSSGGGGGYATTTTASFSIAVPGSTQTVSVTDATGMHVGDTVIISDGVSVLVGLIGSIASLDIDVVTQYVYWPTATISATMASGASFTQSFAPGIAQIQVEDAATASSPMNTMNLAGDATTAGSASIDLYVATISNGTATISGYPNTNFTIDKIAGSVTAKDYVAAKPGLSTEWGHLEPSSSGDVLRSLDGSGLGFGKLTASSSITSGTITPSLLNATNSPTDTYALTYDLASTHFKWVANSSLPGGGTTAQFLRGDVSYTNKLLGPMEVGNTSSTTLSLNTANVAGGNPAVQAIVVPLVSGSATGSVPIYLSGQTSIGLQYTKVDSSDTAEMLQVNGIARATSWRSTQGTWSEIYELIASPGTNTIDLVNGNYQRITSITADMSISLTDTTTLPTSLRFANVLTLEINAPGTHVTSWGAEITWANGGSAPTLNTTGINLVSFVRRQGQAQWIGFVENPISGSGTVTSVASGSGLTGGPITSTGTLSIATGGVTGTMIANNTITNSNVSASANIAVSKLALPGGTSNFLRADGTWQVPPGTGGGGGGGPTLAATQTWTGVNTYTNTTNWTNTPTSGVSTSVKAGVSLAYPDTSNALNVSMTCNDSNSAHSNTALTVVHNGGTSAAPDQQAVKIIMSPLQNITSGFNIIFSEYGNYRRINGGDGSGVWFNAWSPCNTFASSADSTGVVHSFSSGSCRIGECNYGNAWAEFGFSDDRPNITPTVQGLEFFPDWLPGDTGATTFTKYHAQWAVTIGYANAATDGSVGTTPKNWTGLLIAENGIVPGGIGMNLHGGSVSTTTTGTFTVAAVGASQTVPVTSVSGLQEYIASTQPGTELHITDGTHKINGYISAISSLNLTFVTTLIIGGSAGNTMASAATVTTGPNVGINLQNVMRTGINFAGSAGGAPTAGGGGTAATFTSTGNAAITMADDQSIKLGSIWLRGHSGALQYSTDGTSWSNVTLP